MPSKARLALDQNLKDIGSLLKIHAEKGGDSPGRRYGLEVLNKSAVVLITSFWEAYCEDIAEEALELIVNHAPSTDVLPKEIKKHIASRIKADPNELAVWQLSGERWRQVLRDNLRGLQESRNRKLNTPKSKNIDELFESAIGLSSVSSSWNWANKLPAAKAAAKLDRYVELRGEIAHRGKTKTSVKKAQVVDYLDFIKNAAAKTGGTVNAHVKKITGQALW